jgi:hypothetical protein
MLKLVLYKECSAEFLARLKAYAIESGRKEANVYFFIRFRRFNSQIRATLNIGYGINIGSR